jgi:hypothetical protein
VNKSLHSSRILLFHNGERANEVKSMGKHGGCAALGCALIIWMGFATAADAASRPTIEHQPVPVAAQGQSLSILARVKPGAARIKSVTLHYAPSRDGSPIKLLMTPSGGGLYAATIPADHLSSTATLSYYIEAFDDRDEWAETRWFDVRLDSGRAPEVIQHAGGAGESGPVDVDTSPDGAGKKSNTTKIVVGSALAVGAIVGIAAAAGGGGGGGGGGSNTNTMGGGTSPPTEPDMCETSDAVGTWIGLTDPAVAPGFALLSGNTGQFFIEIGGAPVAGSWTLVGCELTLLPPEEASVYRGSGTLSEDKTTVTINGFEFRKGG